MNCIKILYIKQIENLCKSKITEPKMFIFILIFDKEHWYTGTFTFYIKFSLTPTHNIYILCIKYYMVCNIRKVITGRRTLGKTGV